MIFCGSSWVFLIGHLGTDFGNSKVVGIQLKSLCSGARGRNKFVLNIYILSNVIT